MRRLPGLRHDACLLLVACSVDVALSGRAAKPDLQVGVRHTVLPVLDSDLRNSSSRNELLDAQEFIDRGDSVCSENASHRAKREPSGIPSFQSLKTPLSPDEADKAILCTPSMIRFRAGLNLALQAASSDFCPSEGEYHDFGCAPKDPAIPACKCDFAFFRDCHNEAGIVVDPTVKGLAEKHAKISYAGQCRVAPWVHTTGGLLIQLVAGVALYYITVVMNKARVEHRESRTVHQANNALFDPERDELFKEMFSKMEDGEFTMQDLMFQLSRMSVSQYHTYPFIEGNLLRFLAFGLVEGHPLLRAGNLCLILVQLLGPLGICIWASNLIDWQNSVISFSHYQHENATFGISRLTTDILACLFIYCFVLHSLRLIQNRGAEADRLLRLVCNLPTHLQAQINLKLLYLDVVGDCYTIIMCSVAMFLIFKLSNSPKDILFDAMGLSYLFNLDRIDGEYSFVKSSDWNSQVLGEFSVRYTPHAADGSSQGDDSEQGKTPGERNIRGISMLHWLYTATQCVLFFFLINVPLGQILFHHKLHSTHVLTVGDLAVRLAASELKI